MKTIRMIDEFCDRLKVYAETGTQPLETMCVVGEPVTASVLENNPCARDVSWAALADHIEYLHDWSMFYSAACALDGAIEAIESVDQSQKEWSQIRARYLKVGEKLHENYAYYDSDKLAGKLAFVKEQGMDRLAKMFLQAMNK